MSERINYFLVIMFILWGIISYYYSYFSFIHAILFKTVTFLQHFLNRKPNAKCYKYIQKFWHNILKKKNMLIILTSHKLTITLLQNSSTLSKNKNYFHSQLFRRKTLHLKLYTIQQYPKKNLCFQKKKKKNMDSWLQSHPPKTSPFFLDTTQYPNPVILYLCKNFN